MLQNENTIISDKEIINQEKSLIPLKDNIFNIQFGDISHIYKNDFDKLKCMDLCALTDEEKQENEAFSEFNLDEPQNSLDEDEDEDKDEFEDIYFIKKKKSELHSTDSSKKTLDIREKKADTPSEKTYFKLLLSKRGRKTNKKNKKIHGPADYDNIQRKIQVSFITFLIRFGNDILKSIFGKKTKYEFKDVDYKLKKTVNHDYCEELKKRTYSDIIQMKISPKNKNFLENTNEKTFNKICNYSDTPKDTLKDTLKKFFEKNYLYMFQNYYCKIKNEEIIDIDGIKITLSQRTKTKTLFNLLNKNKANREKFIIVIMEVYFSKNYLNSDKKFIISPFEQ